MRIFKTLIIVAFAFATSAGMLLAADDPLEIHGGGRVGWTNNTKMGSETTGGSWCNNEMGTMPNYGSSNFMSLSFAKKVTAENGAWAKTFFAFDDWRGEVSGDLNRFGLRLRDFHEEFGGLDFLPAGAVLWGGLRGYGAGWNGQQDHGFIDFNGLGFGIQNIGGVFSLAYFHQTKDLTDGTKSEWDNRANWGNGEKGLGQRVSHNIVASIAIPVADVYAAYGFSKKADAAGEKNLSQVYIGGIYHAPVLGINIGANFATNGYAREIFTGRSDTNFKGNHFSGVNEDKKQKYNIITVCAWSVSDLAPGLYMAPAIRFDRFTIAKNAFWNTDGDGSTPEVAVDKKVVLSTLHASFRISKALTKNIAFCPTVGYLREWTDMSGDKAKQEFQITPAVEIGLDTGYWASQKLQFYGVYTKIDKDHKLGSTDADGTKHGAFYNKTSAITYGMLVTFGF